MKKQELRLTGLPESPDTHIQVHIVKCDIGDGKEKAIALYFDSHTVAFVMNDTEEKYHLMWFKLDNYVSTDFDSWKILKETTEYKNQ